MPVATVWFTGCRPPPARAGRPVRPDQRAAAVWRGPRIRTARAGVAADRQRPRPARADCAAAFALGARQHGDARACLTDRGQSSAPLHGDPFSRGRPDNCRRRPGGGIPSGERRHGIRRHLRGGAQRVSVLRARPPPERRSRSARASPPARGQRRRHSDAAASGSVNQKRLPRPARTRPRSRPHELHELARDRQTERSFKSSASWAVRLHERLEHLALLRRFDADAGIFDLEHQSRARR